MGSAQLLHELPDNRSEDCEKDNRDEDTENEGRHAPFYHGGDRITVQFQGEPHTLVYRLGTGI